MKKSLAVTLVILFTSSVWADYTELGNIPIASGANCQARGITLGGCQVPTRTLIAPLDYEGTTFETDFTLAYQFQCQGHTNYFRASAGMGTEKEVYPTVPMTSAHVRITGSQSLQFYVSNASDFAKYARFADVCEIKNVVVGRSPSVNTVTLWEAESRYQKKVMEYASDAFRLVSGLEAIQVFDEVRIRSIKNRLEDDVIEELEDLIDDLDPDDDEETIEILEERIRDTKKVIEKLERALNEQTLPDFGQGGGGFATLKAHFLERLQSELEVADDMANRFYRFGYDAKAKAMYESKNDADPNGMNGCGVINNLVSPGGNGGCFDMHPQVMLAWSRPAARSLTFDEAKSYCENLTDAGETDWRLPTEEKTLVGLSHAKNITKKDMSGPVWTGTASPAGPPIVVFLNENGAVGLGVPDNGRAKTICVR